MDRILKQHLFHLLDAKEIPLHEKYWEEHPGQEVPLMKPMFYGGPWRVMRGDVPPMGKFDL
ncbi:hypothetical protein KY289_011979 [Solanum tuberosum]|nr:hypothetical protein KY289_011979 [Solanum tuberosum]